MGRGDSRPRKVLANDGRSYVVKFAMKDGPWNLVNELIAGQVGVELGLYGPEQVLMEYEHEDFSGVVPGPLLAYPVPGSSFLDGWTIPDIKTAALSKKHIANPENAAGILVLDALVQNMDRHPGNVFLEAVDGVAESARYKIAHIDNDKAFLGRWSPADLPNRASLKHPRPAGYLASLLVDCLGGFDDMDPYIDSAVALSAAKLNEIASTVPDQWGFSQDHSDAVVEYFKIRQPLLEERLKGFDNPFKATGKLLHDPKRAYTPKQEDS